MMQSIAMNWTVFSLTLAALALFGTGYAMLVRAMSKHKVRGQTAYMVVFGVGVTVLASIFTFGLLPVAILLAYFSASGLPVVIEYVLRVNDELRKDEEGAAALAKEALNRDGQA